MTSPNKVVHVQLQDLSLVWHLQQASMLLADDIVNYIYKVMIYTAIVVQTSACSPSQLKSSEPCRVD